MNYPPDYRVLQATAPPPSDDVTQLSPSSDHNQPVGESKNPEGDILERQPIYAQVKKISDTDDANKDSEEAKQTNKEEAETISTKNVYTVPKHRSRCVACGCPRVCCVRNFVFLWIVLFILLQGGPLAVLIIDLITIKSEGATVHRYIAEWDMKPAVCTIQGYYISDFKSCGCLLSTSNACDELIQGYGCIQVMGDVKTYHESRPIARKTFIWKSEREYVLDTVEPKCFNLDICTIDKNKPWHEYRNATKQDERILQEKQRAKEGIVCYYKENGDKPIVIMQMNTSFWKVLIWFILPLAGLLVCWLMICICLCWYCCPKQKARVNSKEKSGENSEPDEGGESRYLMPYND